VKSSVYPSTEPQLYTQLWPELLTPLKINMIRWL